MTRRRFIHIFLFSLLLVLPLAESSKADGFPDRAPITLNDAMTEREAAPYLQELVPSDSSLAIGDILSPQQQARFTSVGPEVPNYGYDAGVRWFKLPVRNDSKQEEWLLELAYAPIDHADLYVVRPGGTPTIQRGGDLLPFRVRDVHTRTIVFRINLAAGETAELYLRVDTEGATAVPLRLVHPAAFAEREQTVYLILGIYYGMLAVLTLYNTVLAFSLRSRAYFYYVGINTSVLLIYASLNGIAFQYVWPEAVWWNNRAIVFFICLGMLASLFFTRSFLDGRRLFPRLNRWFALAAALEALNLAVLLADYRAGLQMAMYSTPVVEVTIVIAGVLSWRAGFRPARYFLLGWGFFMFGAIVSSLTDAGYLPYTTWTAYASQLGSALEATILSWALAARIRQIRKEKEMAVAEMRETRKLADRDDLTGLYNRRYAADAFADIVSQDKRLSVLLLDIDHFKLVNDTYGHDAGDAVLRRIARMLQDCLRPTDIVGRFGGEEFVVLLPDTGIESARRAAEYALQTIRQTVLTVRGTMLHVTVSIGVTAWTGEGDDSFARVLRRADEALYTAKEQGRNRVEMAAI